MAVEVVSDPELEGYNSFVSLEEANSYFEGTYFPEGITPWEDLEPDTQARLLVTASRALSALNWAGITPDGQVLAFPRAFTRYHEYGGAPVTETPGFVRGLTLEYAKWMWQEADRPLPDADLSAFSSLSVGDLSVTLRDAPASPVQLPPPVLALLQPLVPTYLTLGHRARSVSLVY